MPFGTDPEADGRLNGLIPESIDGADGNHYIYTGMLKKSYEPVQGVRENGTITVYYMTDNDGPDKKPDGIPDAYEIQFIFESSNEHCVSVSITTPSKSNRTAVVFVVSILKNKYNIRAQRSE